jgi:hypothetical protein
VAGVYPGPRVQDCQTKATFLRKITSVLNELSELYQREARVMAQADRLADAVITAEIELAQKRRTALLIQFQDHVERHGC